MIFFSKRETERGQSSNMEACVSILGLFLAIGIIGGLSALIYGLIKETLSVTIVGGVVLGVSAIFSIILALVFVYCLKKNNVDSNEHEQRGHTNQHQYKQNRHQRQHQRRKHEQKTSSHEISVIPATHEYEQQQPNGLTDSTNSGYGRQVSRSPSKSSPFVYLNQSNGSIHNQNYPSSMNLNTRPSNQN